MSIPGDNQPKMPYVRWCQYRTSYPGGLARSRRARWKHALYAAEALAEQKRVRELLGQSRELETDASRLNGRRHGAWGSSAVFVPGHSS